MKRLFLFAAFCPDGVVGPALVRFVSALRGYGEVILYADSDISAEELAKLDGLVINSGAEHHGEYDFGSYKRCWEWAKNSLDIASFDFVYLVNDSVFGPLKSMEPAFGAMENAEGLNGMAFNPRKKGPHVQSWFVKLPKTLFLSREFDAFIEGVRHEDDKNDVCEKYETGLTALASEMGIEVGGFVEAKGNTIYNNVIRMHRRGLPFVKKSAFTRHNGSLGMKLNTLLKKVDPATKEAIKEETDRLQGSGYLDNLLTANPIAIAKRYFHYILGKIR